MSQSSPAPRSPLPPQTVFLQKRMHLVRAASVIVILAPSTKQIPLATANSSLGSKSTHELHSPYELRGSRIKERSSLLTLDYSVYNLYRKGKVPGYMACIRQK